MNGIIILNSEVVWLIYGGAVLQFIGTVLTDHRWVRRLSHLMLGLALEWMAMSSMTSNGPSILFLLAACTYFYCSFYNLMLPIVSSISRYLYHKGPNADNSERADDDRMNGGM